MNRSFVIASAFTLLVTFGTLCRAQEKSDKPARPNSVKEQRIISVVRAVLEAQRDAWNRGDIEGYMDGYARSDETVFVSGDNVTRGWQTVLERYKKNYGSREKMGKLTFSDLEITPLGNDAAVVLGRWHLERSNDQPHGRFTLLLRKTRQGWKIIHDHTSSA
jgi:ketosteroid isomerase-like protein